MDRRAIADYRMRTADLYAEVRRTGASEESWTTWRAGRDRLLRTHVESPLYPVAQDWPGQPFWEYDPSWHVLGEVIPDTDGTAIEIQQASGLVERFDHAGVIRFEHDGTAYELPIYWAWSYSGGWFLPFRDATSGSETFGVGRYLLDQAKSANLGEIEGRLVLDFNFSYHPSCVWGDWLCPLPRPESTLPVGVLAGEKATA